MPTEASANHPAPQWACGGLVGGFGGGLEGSEESDTGLEPPGFEAPPEDSDEGSHFSECLLPFRSLDRARGTRGNSPIPYEEPKPNVDRLLAPKPPLELENSGWRVDRAEVADNNFRV